MKKRQRRRNRQRPKKRSNSALAFADTNHRGLEPVTAEGVESAPSKRVPGTSVLTHAIRATGILPIAVLIGILTTHHLYTDQIPQWFVPILEKQVATLTLCAGHAAIIGLWINREIRHRWGTFALIVAAFSTAGAGYRSIGEDVAGQVVVILLFMLLVPAIWAESISCGLARFYRFLRTKKGLLTIGLMLWVPLALYNQWQNENYIRNWLLIPLGIFCGFVISAFLLWLTFRLSVGYLPVVYSWGREGLVNIYKKWLWRGKRD